MSAPAMKVRPAPINTTASAVESRSAASIAARIPSGTPGLRALTGGLSMAATRTPLVWVTLTNVVMHRILKHFQSSGHADQTGAGHAVENILIRESRFENAPR